MSGLLILEKVVVLWIQDFLLVCVLFRFSAAPLGCQRRFPDLNNDRARNLR